MLRHLPFFEALAGMQEGTADWQAVSAGLGVLRLVDEWVEGDAAAPVRNRWGLRTARQAVEAMSTGKPARAVLAGIVGLIESADVVDVDVLAPRLIAYGHALDLDGAYALAADVFETLIGIAHPEEQADIAFDAAMRLGYCYRMLGRYDEAATGYAAAGRIAAGTADQAKVLRVRVADAKLALARGNLPAAERILDEVVREAGERGLTTVRGIALHDRAAVAHGRGSYEQAISFLYEALQDSEHALARDRVLADIGMLFAQLGMRTAARDALLVLTGTAQEQYTRWAAMLNLLELSADDGAELAFEQHRRELAKVDLPVDLATTYHLFVGRGYRLFGRVAPARRALQHALDLACQHQLNQLRFDAEQAVEELERGERVAARQAVQVSAALQPVASAMRELRSLAGVG